MAAMTVAQTYPQLLSLADWRALGEDEDTRTELQEGVLFVLPGPAKSHARVISRLVTQISAQLPDGVEALAEVDLVVDSSTPATVRVPDVVICAEFAEELLESAQVEVVVEVLSPGTRRTDLVTKRSEYADAGIGHYWIIDRDLGVLTALELTDDGDVGTDHTGVFSTEKPYPLSVDIDALSL